MQHYSSISRKRLDESDLIPPLFGATAVMANVFKPKWHISQERKSESYFAGSPAVMFP